MAKFMLNFWDVNGEAHQIEFEGEGAQKKAEELQSVIQEVTRNSGALKLDEALLQPGSQHASFVAEVFEIDPHHPDGAKAALQEYKSQRFQEQNPDGPPQVVGFGPVAKDGEETAENTKPVQVDHTQS